MATSVPARRDAARGPEPLPVKARRHPLVGEVGRRLSGCCGVPPGARVLVGVSGGADSVALLLATAALAGRRTQSVEPVAVHVNHHLRDSAGEDESFVRALCERFAIPLHVRHVDPGRLDGNTPANARRLRYQAIESVAASLDARFVAVAHHAEDQLETMLMALARGAGLEGLSGMSWRRPLGAGALVRPMLALRKATCEDFCRAAGIAWREDPTNADAGTARGRLRRDVLGVLDELWPDAAIRAGRAADLIAAASAALDREVEGVFGDPSARRWSRAQIAAQPAGVIAAGLRRAAMAAEPDAADDLGGAQAMAVAEAVADGVRRPRTFDWPRGIRVHVTAREVRMDVTRQ